MGWGSVACSPEGMAQIGDDSRRRLSGNEPHWHPIPFHSPPPLPFRLQGRGVGVRQRSRGLIGPSRGCAGRDGSILIYRREPIGAPRAVFCANAGARLCPAAIGRVTKPVTALLARAACSPCGARTGACVPRRGTGPIPRHAIRAPRVDRTDGRVGRISASVKDFFRSYQVATTDPIPRIGRSREPHQEGSEAGAPEAEIEVTPAMIEAGDAITGAFDRDFRERISTSEMEELLRRVYRAMETVKAARVDLIRGSSRTSE